MLGKSSLLDVYKEDSEGTTEQKTGTTVKYDGEGCRFCVLQITCGAEECCDIIDRLDLSLSQGDRKLQAAKVQYVCTAVWLQWPSLPLSITGYLQSGGGVVVVFPMWEPLVRRGYGLAGCDAVCRLVAFT